jgi:hypothetical protein
MKLTKNPNSALIIFPLLLLLSSCLGVNADVTLTQNGSGTIALEYVVSRSLDSLGKLDGNERWNTIPVGRADFERTLDRLPEMKLLSFSSKETNNDIVVTAKMEFKSVKGLLAFLDAGGRRSSFSGDGRSGTMAFTLSEGMGKNDPGLDKLLAVISNSYSVKMSMNFPAEGNLSVKNSKGLPLAAIPGSEIVSKGKRVSFSFPLYQVLSSTEGINVEFRW